MNPELKSLLASYKTSLESLSEINTKAEKVNLSKAIANRLNLNEAGSFVEEKALLETNDSNKKLNEIISKLGTDVDLVLNKRQAEVKTSQLAVQSFIVNAIWKLNSRNELLNNAGLLVETAKREEDTVYLLELISTCFTFERQISQQRVDTEQKGSTIFLTQLHKWMIHLMTIYLRISTSLDKKKLLLLLVSTPNISTWAIPLIQFHITDTTDRDDYIQVLGIIFTNHVWTEDDFLVVIDQLAIDLNFNRAIESMDTPDLLFQFSMQLTNCLITAIRAFYDKSSLMKRVSQIVVQISMLLVDAVSEKEWKCQDQMDEYLHHLIRTFHNLKQYGWFFLPNIPFRALSTDALWTITTELLQIQDKTPSSLDQVTGQYLPNITRFQYELQDNQTQGYFMLTCLTNIALAVQEDTLSTCIVAAIAYALFNVAFIDKQLREVFYKDVRDNLAMMCRYHPFTIPLLFSWTVENLSVMERMSLYLFHSIRLDQWPITKEDLKRVQKLLSSNHPQQAAHVQLGKHILSQLNYGYKHDSIDPSESQSQPWHHRKLPYLSYEIHEELAFMLLNVCQQFLPLPDTSHKQENKGAIELVGTVTSATSTYLPIADQIQLLKLSSSSTHGNDILQWAWTIAVRLKLYDCPLVPRANELEASIDLAFLKLVFNSHNATAASHSALMLYISFMLSATSRHFLRFESSDGWMKLLVILKRGKPEAVIRMLSEIVPSFVYMHGDDFFNDDSLADLFRHMVELKTDPLMTAAAKQLVKKSKISGIGHIIGSHLWQTHLIDGDEHSKGFSYVDLMMHSWLKTVFRKSDWMWQSNYISAVDDMCKFSFVLDKHDLIRHMLEEEQKRMDAVKSPRLARFLKNMVVTEGTFSSLLTGEWSMLKVNATPGIESHYVWFAFQVLVVETAAEKSCINEMAQLVSKQLSTSLTNDQQQPLEQQQAQKNSLDLAAIHKLTQTKKPLESFAIYRWLQHLLVIPTEHPLLPLFCQMFIRLYFQVLDVEHKMTLGHLFFSKKKDQIIKLKEHIATIQNNQKTDIFRQFYYAVWSWLNNEDLLHLEVNLQSLPDHYDIARLESIDKYWLDLVNIDQLEQEFLNFEWEGADKFRTDQPYEQKSVNTEDLVSLATTARRLKAITDESMIEPLPSVVINTPDTSKQSQEEQT